MGSAVKHAGQSSDVIDLVLLVEKLDAFGYAALGHILGEVHEHRLDRSDLSVLDLGQELALVVTVGLDRSDGGSCDLLDVFVLSDAFIDSHITVRSEIFVGPVHNLLFCDFLQPLHLECVILPVVAVDE